MIHLLIVLLHCLLVINSEGERVLVDFAWFWVWFWRFSVFLSLSWNRLFLVWFSHLSVISNKKQTSTCYWDTNNILISVYNSLVLIITKSWHFCQFFFSLQRPYHHSPSLGCVHYITVKNPLEQCETICFLGFWFFQIKQKGGIRILCN